jgi:hypothetical protein
MCVRCPINELGTAHTMTDKDQAIQRRVHEPRHIELPNGSTLIPRREFADILGEDERTTRKRNLPTTYIANLAYVDREASLKIVAEGLHCRNQPEPRLRKRLGNAVGRRAR